MITIFENTPYRTDKNLIESYNSFMKLLPNDGWALFRDADTLFLDSFYGDLIVEAISNNKDVDCFTCLTNRIGNPKQLFNEYNGDDIIKHREVASSLRSKYGSICEDFTKPILPYIMSGMCFILSKKAWEKIGGFKEYTPGYGKMLGVDNKLHIDLYENGFKTKIIKGLYVYHWYRGGKRNDIKHLL
mgnify:CR=1 FL=1|tara:strand:- start:3699 stop:4259 length:561 start_codon:yes stop_codon:yes gene_type:complete